MAEAKRTFLSRSRVEEMLDAARWFPHTAEDWSKIDYEHPIKKIVYRGQKNFDLLFNLRMARKTLFARKGWLAENSLRRRLGVTFYSLIYADNHVPDATIYGGSIITHWAEHGEYLAEMLPKDVEAALRELLVLRAFKEEMGYLALSADADMVEEPADREKLLAGLHAALERVAAEGDWLEDPALTREERLEKFEALHPEPTKGPEAERLAQVRILAEGWRIAADEGLITAESAEEFARITGETLEAVLRGETSYGKPVAD